MTLTCHNDERVRVYVYFFPFDFSERVSFIQSVNRPGNPGD